ncbi:NTP transferase domain-containing protein [Candidatus Nitrosocosmicus sp. T]
MINCVLMCGGKGSRLNANSISKVEKPLLELKNKSLIEYMIEAIQNSKKNFKIYAAVSKNTVKTKEFLRSRYFNVVTLVETTGSGFSIDYLNVLRFFKSKEIKEKNRTQDFVNNKILFLPADLPLISSKTLDEITDLKQIYPSIAIVVDKKIFIQNNFVPSTFVTEISKIDHCYTGISLLDFHTVAGLEHVDQIIEVPMIMNNLELVYNINTIGDLKKAEKLLNCRI